MTTPPNGPSHRPEPPLAALTEENIIRLDREHDQESANMAKSADSLDHLRPSTAGGEDEWGSFAVHTRNSSRSRSTVGSLTGSKKPNDGGGRALELSMRGTLKRGESDRTVTLGNYADGKPL